MEVQQQEANSIVEVSKREFGSAMSFVRRQAGRISKQAVTPENEQHKLQILHRYRMGFAVSGGCFGGLMAGHAATLWTTAAMCFIVLSFIALCFGAIGKIESSGAQ